jgi:hypothetical protein
VDQLIIGLLIGFTFAFSVFGLAVTGYVLKKYVYATWKVVRADQLALNAELLSIRQELGARKALIMDPETQARAEQKARMRRAAGGIQDES